MRLCILAPSTAIGGAEHYLVQVANSLGAGGCSVSLAVNDDDETTAFYAGRTTAGLFPGALGWHGSADDLQLGDALRDKVLRQAAAAAEVIIATRAEALMVNLPWPDFGHGIVLAAAALGVPAAILCHLCPRMLPMPRELQRIYRALAAGGQKYATVSEDNRVFFSATTTIPRSQIAVLYNGVEVDPHWASLGAGQREAGREALRRELDLPADARFAVTVGRLDYQKGHHDLVDAALKACDGREDLHYLWLGSGPLAEHLRKVIDSVGLADRIHLLGQRPDVPRFLALADFLIAPSYFEGFSLTLLEAASYGCPIVASDCSGTRELLAGPHDGVLFPTGHTSDLAEAIAWAADNAAWLTAVGRCGRGRVASFTPAQMLAALEGLIGEARLGGDARRLPAAQSLALPDPPARTPGEVVAWARRVLATPEHRPGAAGTPSNELLAALYRDLLLRHRVALRRLRTLRPQLQRGPWPVIAASDLPEWLDWRVWQYPMFWIVEAAPRHRLAMRLVRVDRSLLDDHDRCAETLAVVSVPTQLAEPLDDENDHSLVLAPRLAWRRETGEVRLEPPADLALPPGLAGGVAVAGGALHVLAQLAAFLGCARLLATPRILAGLPFGNAVYAARTGSDADIGVVFRTADRATAVEARLIVVARRQRELA